MGQMLRLSISLFFLGFFSISFAQDYRDASFSLSLLEKELATMGDKILKGNDTPEKITINQTFFKRLMVILKRPDSYDYTFDSLKTISRIFPEDNSFRIFTWMLVDKDTMRMYENHHYFGIIQRRISAPEDPNIKVQVIALKDSTPIFKDMETIGVTNQNWMGALYYKPRFSDYGVLTYKGKYQTVSGITGKNKIKPVTYYILMGWNGEHKGSSYKMLDVLTFDEKDPNLVHFGAPIFYFSKMPKSRVVFKYSDNSPFSLNLGYVIHGVFKRKKQMVVFDRLAEPSKGREHQGYAVGVEGTYDALHFTNRIYEHRKGFFYALKNVTVYNEATEKYDPKYIQKQAREEDKRLHSLGIQNKKAGTNLHQIPPPDKK